MWGVSLEEPSTGPIFVVLVIISFILYWDPSAKRGTRVSHWKHEIWTWDL